MNTIITKMMKHNVLLGIVTIIVMTLISCGEEKKKQNVDMNTSAEIEDKKENVADIADASFSDEMTTKVFHNYLQIRTALVNADVTGVQIATGNLSDSLTEEGEAIKTIAQQLAESDNIERQRELFSDFTNSVESLFKDNLAQGTIYKQFCPMAFNNKGAYWFSNVSEIRNPYFGDKMLKCGKVTETIEK